MVARIVIGAGIIGPLNYNEKKVNSGKAELLHAEGYPKDKGDLSFKEKLTLLSRLTEMNEGIRKNCLHISLNFDPSERPSDKKLVAIAEAYMQKIGFGKQPYLLYRHDDAAHPHVHLVTTNVQMNGKGLSLHNIGKLKSEPARKEIEKTFGLVPAGGRKNALGDILKPIAAKAFYGKSETKAAISNVVRAVVRDYKFCSLAELNAVLNGLNVTAYRGEEGTKQFERKGLSYCMLDEGGNRTGVPIKASSIYSKPTLANLEQKFEANAEKRKPYRDRLKNIIDKTLSAGFIPDKEALRDALSKQGIAVLFRQNETMLYGITYIDHAAKTVFNGSMLGKDYSAKRMMERIGLTGFEEQLQRNKNKALAEKSFKGVDFRKGAAPVVASLYAKGMRMCAEEPEGGRAKYYFGHKSTRVGSYHPAGEKLSAYFIVNKITSALLAALNLEAGHWDNGKNQDGGLVAHLENYISGLLAAAPEPSLPMHHDKKKKRKRKPNW